MVVDSPFESPNLGRVGGNIGCEGRRMNKYARHSTPSGFPVRVVACARAKGITASGGSKAVVACGSLQAAHG